MTARIVVTPEAEEQVRAIDSWWRKERPAAPNLFGEELAAAFELLSNASLGGRRYIRANLFPRTRLAANLSLLAIYLTGLTKQLYALGIHGNPLG
jgi:plasmid stabilization system protein ParE